MGFDDVKPALALGIKRAKQRSAQRVPHRGAKTIEAVPMTVLG
jgi:hypothetical protein